MTLNIQPKPCLDVAVDHRIRRLFKPVCNDLTECSNHVSRIETRGRLLERPHSEIQVTTQLTGPAFKGGIAVTLQQPRNNHPFEGGLDAVIRDCQTLYALDTVFSVVSCGSLDIRTNITIVDLLPYVSESVAYVDDTTLEEAFRASKHIILDKEPSVLLCAERIWAPGKKQFDERKGDAYKLESIKLEKFGDKYPVKARIRREGKRGFVTICRVNGFHPSYAMNHNPHVSCLRQLQILIGAQTCGVLRGDWEEEDWMDKLRRRCQVVSTAPSESPTQSQSQGSGQSFARRNTKYLPDYQELYSGKLRSIHRFVKSLLSKPIPTGSSSTSLYEPLLTCGLSEICNDVQGVLTRQLQLHQHVRSVKLRIYAMAKTLHFQHTSRELLLHWRFRRGFCRGSPPAR